MMPKAFSLSLLVAILFSCGVEVGNPTKPIEGVPTADEQAAFALSAADQYEESVASTTDNDDATEASLLLANSLDCRAQADGSLLVTSMRSKDRTATFPRKAPKQSITISTSTQLSSVLTSSSGTLKCKADGSSPALDLAALKQYTVATQVTRDLQRKETEVSSGSALSDRSTHTTGTRSKAVRYIGFVDRVLSLEKSVEFSSSIQKGTETALGTKTTLPLVMQIKRSSGALQSLKIVSGAVSSTMVDGRTLVLTYSNVELQAGTQCHPDGGSVKAEVFAADQITVPVYTFSIVFSESESHLLFADGTQKDLVVADCSFGDN